MAKKFRRMGAMFGGIDHPAQCAALIAPYVRQMPAEKAWGRDSAAWGEKIAVRSRSVSVLLFRGTPVDTVRVSSKGQIVIPKAVRDAKRIEAGTELAISVIGDEIRLTVAAATRATSVRDVAGILARPPGKRLARKQEQELIAALVRKSDRATRR